MSMNKLSEPAAYLAALIRNESTWDYFRRLVDDQGLILQELPMFWRQGAVDLTSSANDRGAVCFQEMPGLEDLGRFRLVRITVRQ